MKWLEIEQPTGGSVPLWQRSGAVADDGTVFIPAAVTGSEIDIETKAKAANIEVVSYLDHVFVPAKWLGEEFSGIKQLCQMMEQKVRDLNNS